MQRQISNWTKDTPVLAETGTGCDNSNLNSKKRKSFEKYKVTNAREVAQPKETFKQKVQAKAQRIRRYKKRELKISSIRCSSKTPKNFTES
jgi:hypothetical protein